MNGARQGLKRAELYETMRQKNIDIVFLQETHSDLLNSADWAREFKGQALLSHNTTSSGGVAILFSSSCAPVCFQV